MAVFPPTAASTMPSSVVGTSTTGTPRSQVAAANPARSVAAPPPMPTTQSDRVTRESASHDHSRAATATSLAASPSGISASGHGEAGVGEHPAGGPGDRAEPGGVDDRHGLRPLAHQVRQRAEHPGAHDHLVRLLAADLDTGLAHARSRLARSAATSSGAMSSAETVMAASSA